ncbi:DNA-binding PucR family transcriptional regulator [Actinomadura pelletieri DSM 43383]|uniref:DNA-binding PucR family transcriptional regulator n=1 Tax=Actinomadura pelletieri DSM 43383 TaxID=1120940 RepID=A0A495QTM6_9ACTN|nr:DNA-binding PucR family transcriptional regulator [Actinomadura pelletieri DSM 43383]
MITVSDFVESLGPALLRLVAPGRDTQVHDVVLAEETAGRPGEIVLGAGTTDAVALLERADAAGAAGVVLKAPLPDEAVTAAHRLSPALVELQPETSWTHVIWLARAAIDHAYAPPGPSGDDLFALADTAAEIADAPVTLEDARSRVLAYSGLQGTTDPARVSTIVGRRVPPQVIAHLRACGVFRRMARSSDPIMVPAGPDGMFPRLVVPVRAGGEWLGSIWAVAKTPIPPDRVARLTDLASVVALHLLRLRAETGVARRVSADRLRAALRDGTTPVPARPPWRVVTLGGESGDIRRRLDLWEAITHRFGWHRPLLTDLDDTLFAVLTDLPNQDPGSMPWLHDVVTRVRTHAPDLYAAVGGPAATLADLPRSRAESAELAALLSSGRLPLGLVSMDDAWPTVTVERARQATGTHLLGGPLPTLQAHDRKHQTAFLPTLAAWLDHYGDTKATALALDVHPNTLRHRLKRMTEVTPLDLTSRETRLALRLQLTTLNNER